MRTKKHYLAIALVAALAASCGGLKPPPQLSPTGDLYFRANQVVLALNSLKNVTISAENQGLIARNDADTVLTNVKKALLAAGDLVKAVHAGAEAEGAKAKAIAVINQVLADVVPQLSQRTQELIAPYIAVVRTLLAAFS